LPACADLEREALRRHNARPDGSAIVYIHFDLPYPGDGAALFAPLALLPWAHWLDSAWPASRAGRYDIFTALPRATLVTRDAETRIEHADGRVERSRAQPLELLRAQLGPRRPSPATPFAGGALGYFGYDLGRRLHRLPSLARDGEGLPEMAVGLYDGALVIDHHEQSCRLWASDDADGRAWAARFLARLRAAPVTSDFTVTGEIEASLSPAAYRRAFARVQRYIRAGDCYQVNLALRFTAPCQGDPWPLYLALRARNPAPFSAWLNFPFGQVLSSSPERFLSVRDDWVETRPIKGTRPRGADPGEDARRMAELAGSAKDRAENLMIVDLLRNDLGQVCVPGSVTVPSLFTLESYATVHHLVSSVRGRLRPGMTALDQLAAAFPGGSITGAPKLRAMEIIEELEAERRGVYCGAIGYLGHDGGMDSNIAIRTLTHVDDRIRFWAGGGLVADSDADSEYRECQDKARAPREVLAGFRERLASDAVSEG
jgi:para-aminobenzoate synthetase component 1